MDAVRTSLTFHNTAHNESHCNIMCISNKEKTRFHVSVWLHEYGKEVRHFTIHVLDRPYKQVHKEMLHAARECAKALGLRDKWVQRIFVAIDEMAGDYICTVMRGGC